MNFGSAAEVRQEVASLFSAPRRLPVADAVAQYMRVPKGGNNSDAWDPLLAPYMIEPMNCLNSRLYDAVVFVGPARTGKTIGLIDGWITYTICCDPGDFLLVQLTEEKAREHSRKRLDRMFRVSPEIHKRLSPRRNDNNVHDKVFRAGNYLKIGWPTNNIMASSDYRFVALTDYDRWDDDIDGEGDGFSQASKRTTTFMSSGMTLVESSPGKPITDTKYRVKTNHEYPPCVGIGSLYNRGDRRRLYWPCPHCGDYFMPVLDNMTGYQNIDDPVKASEAAHLQCPHCHGKITAAQKRQLNLKGQWLREGETISKTGERGGEPRRSRIASFWMEGPAAAYQTWTQLLYKLITAEQEYQRTGAETTLQTVINTDWGRPYRPKAAEDNGLAELLDERAESLPKRVIPEGVRFLVAAVDVQGGRNRRFVVQIIGYGLSGERWLIDRYNIRYSARCDEHGEAERIDPASYLEDWDLLRTDVIEKTYPLADGSGRRMPVMWMACDQGGEDGVSDNAYKFWRQMKRRGHGRHVYLVKGESAKTDRLIRKSYPDNTGRTSRNADARGDVPLYLLATDRLKDTLHNNLCRHEVGPGFIHHPDWLGSWFYDELTYEERGDDGKWRKPGKGANEALDLYCYADALVLLKGYYKQKPDNLKPWCRDWNENPEMLNSERSSIPSAGKSSTAPQKTKPTEHHSQPPTNHWLTPTNGGRGGWL